MKSYESLGATDGSGKRNISPSEMKQWAVKITVKSFCHEMVREKHSLSVSYIEWNKFSRHFWCVWPIQNPDSVRLSNTTIIHHLLRTLVHFKQFAAVKQKRKSIGGKKHWITTQLHIINNHTSCLILTTHSFIQNWLPCGPPCRRLARCCHRRQTSPHFQAADTQNGVFIALMRWRDEVCCLCYRLNTH